MREYKEIPLTQGKVALINTEDYDYLNQFKWCAMYNGYAWYAVRNIPKNGKQTTIRMHREILKTPQDMDTDHINMNGLDNRRNNLRICTRSQNYMNRGKYKDNISGYKGVYWYNKKWVAQIKVNAKQIYLGRFKDKEQAAEAYNKAAKKYHGEFARLNNI